MSDIQAGDVVVCVDDAPGPFGSAARLKRGKCYRVVDVYFNGSSGCNVEGVDPRPAVGFLQRRFRKLPKADEQFTRKMRALRPLKIREDA